MFWPVIPLFWIPLHVATAFFKKLGFITYVMPLISWLPITYLIYRNKSFLLQSKISLPIGINIIGILFFIVGSLLHIWTARLLGFRGIIGVPQIYTKVKRQLVMEGPFAIVRHPTYLAHTLIFSGVFLVTGVVSVGIITLLDFIIVNIIILPLEEKELSVHFVEEYRLYKKKVPSRFFPWILRR